MTAGDLIPRIQEIQEDAATDLELRIHKILGKLPLEDKERDTQKVNRTGGRESSRKNDLRTAGFAGKRNIFSLCGRGWKSCMKSNGQAYFPLLWICQRKRS